MPGPAAAAAGSGQTRVMSASPGPPVAHPRWAIIAFAAGLGGVMPLATDIYLIVMPGIARDLGASLAATQSTMATFGLGFGLAHLFVGVAADRWGRRPVAITSLVLFLLASLAVISAPSLEWLNVYRFVQGCFCAACPILSRAIVRDAVPGHELARAYSATNMLSGIAPLLAPFIGAWAAGWGGWRAALAMLALYTATLVGVLIARLPETRPVVSGPHEEPPTPLQAAGQILTHRHFVLGAAAAMLIYSSLFTWLTTSPFLLMDQLGLTPTAAAFVYGTGAGVYILTNLASARWLPGHAPERVLVVGALFMLMGAITARFALARAGIGAAGLIVATTPFYVGLGLAHPNALQTVMRPFAQVAGQASAWLGLFQQLGGVSVSLIAVWLGAGLRAVSVMIGCGLVLLAVSLVLRRTPR